MSEDEQMSVIRPRTDADLDRCVDLLAAVHAHDAYPSRWPTDPGGWLSPKDLDRAWVAEAGPTTPSAASAVVGHVGVTRPFVAPALLAAVDGSAGELAGIVRLFVAPEARRHNIAEQLLTTATDHIRRQGWQAVLDVVESGTAAIALYERLGWLHVTSAPATWVDDAGAHPVVRYYVAPA
jgi:ribosomal protein S18 acetylase RimI-like enzyme